MVIYTLLCFRKGEKVAEFFHKFSTSIKKKLSSTLLIIFIGKKDKK